VATALLLALALALPACSRTTSYLELTVDPPAVGGGDRIDTLVLTLSTAELSPQTQRYSLGGTPLPGTLTAGLGRATGDLEVKVIGLAGEQPLAEASGHVTIQVGAVTSLTLTLGQGPTDGGPDADHPDGGDAASGDGVGNGGHDLPDQPGADVGGDRADGAALLDAPAGLDATDGTGIDAVPNDGPGPDAPAVPVGDPGPCCFVQTLLTLPAPAVAVAVVESGSTHRVYWASRPTFGGSDGSVGYLDLNTSQHPRQDGQSTPEALAVLGTQVFVANWGTASAPGSITVWNDSQLDVFASGVGRPRSIAVLDGTGQPVVYFGDDQTNAQQIRQVTAGGSPTTFDGINAVHPLAMASAGNTVYWANRGSGTATDGSIISRTSSGMLDTPLMSGLAGPTSLAVGSDIVWVDQDGTLQGLSTPAMSGNGGACSTERCGVAIDSSGIYFTNLDGGRIYYLDTRNPTSPLLNLLVDNQRAPTGIATDDAFVYWVNAGDGQLNRVRKP
jgi:hypothetical protein